MRRTLAVLLVLAAATVLSVPIPAQVSAPAWLPQSFDPPWGGLTPRRAIPFPYDPQRTTQQNGAALAAAIKVLQPGDRLNIGAGLYTLTAKFDVSLEGTLAAPIWIACADPKNPPVLTRPDNRQNAMNVGEAGKARYLCFTGLVITGGDDLIKLHDCENVWIDRCHLHDGDGVGIAANSRNTSHLYLTRNVIERPGKSWDTGEGMYLGANYGKVAMSHSIVALNHVSQTQVSTQGDGIEVKQGSHHNWIAHNVVHDTRYPCILVYGTGGNGENVVEGNVCWNCLDNTLQVQGEALVRNNLILNAAGAGFQSHDHQGTSTRLVVVHNTMVTPGRGANLSSWNNRTGMVFANNAVYSQTRESIRFPNGSTGVTLAGNVVVGAVVGAGGGWVKGVGLPDFVDLTWDASRRDATPALNSALRSRGAPAWRVNRDLSGAVRLPPVDAGAVDALYSLTADRTTLSVGSGGTQTFRLDAGQALSGRTYALAGSLSGVRPGVSAGRWCVALNPDAYFFFTVLHPNTLPLAASAGNLDTAGRATARFVLPAGLPLTLVGLRLDHAFAVLAGGGFEHASNSVALSFVR